MPGRRVFRLKPRIEPLTKTAWLFFLATDAAGMDRASEEDGAEFFMLYYVDGWMETFAEHRQEIEAEWRKRGWTKRQKRFVLQLYLERHLSLKQDSSRGERLRIWCAWQDAPEPKIHDWLKYLESIGRLDLYRDLSIDSAIYTTVTTTPTLTIRVNECNGEWLLKNSFARN